MARMTAEQLQLLRTRYPDPPAVFVETGTYQGKTTRFALEQFNAGVAGDQLGEDRLVLPRLPGSRDPRRPGGGLPLMQTSAKAP